MKAYRGSVVVLSVLTIGIGLALIAKGAFGGKPLGLVLGALFAAVGAGRLYLLRGRR